MIDDAKVKKQVKAIRDLDQTIEEQAAALKATKAARAEAVSELLAELEAATTGQQRIEFPAGAGAGASASGG